MKLAVHLWANENFEEIRDSEVARVAMEAWHEDLYALNCRPIE